VFLDGVRAEEEVNDEEGRDQDTPTEDAQEGHTKRSRELHEPKVRRPTSFGFDCRVITSLARSVVFLLVPIELV
jgi:hypothetical protein